MLKYLSCKDRLSEEKIRVRLLLKVSWFPFCSLTIVEWDTILFYVYFYNDEEFRKLTFFIFFLCLTTCKICFFLFWNCLILLGEIYLMCSIILILPTSTLIWQEVWIILWSPIIISHFGNCFMPWNNVGLTEIISDIFHQSSHPLPP